MRTIGFFYKIVFVLFVILASGCSLPGKSTQPTSYDLGPAPASSATAPPAVSAPAAALPTLLLPEFDAAPALDRPAILYRLLYADANALRAYTQAQWRATPAQLVRQRLKAQLAMKRVVLSGSEPAANQAPVLQIDLDAFSHQFDSPTSSHGLVQLRATLSWVTAQGEKRVAQKSFAAQRPAPSADAGGGVRALAQATGAVVADVDQWVQSVK
jgi:cholesterol transport system auxiliary component